MGGGKIEAKEGGCSATGMCRRSVNGTAGQRRQQRLPPPCSLTRLARAKQRRETAPGCQSWELPMLLDTSMEKHQVLGDSLEAVPGAGAAAGGAAGTARMALGATCAAAAAVVLRRATMAVCCSRSMRSRRRPASCESCAEAAAGG